MPPNLERVAFLGTPIETVAVAVCRAGGGTHAGVAYRGPDGTAKLLHLAFHEDLREDDFDRYRPRYVCVVPNLPRPDLVALAGYCRRIYRANAARRIPYNLAYEAGTKFDPGTGDCVLAEGGTGMRCATFVVHLFRSAGNPIIDVREWRVREPEDGRRQAELVEAMQRAPSPVYQREAARIRGEIGCPRVRPEDVGGGCLEDVLPAPFEWCDCNGRCVLAMLRVVDP